tara:strand:- start:2099 stop:2839 length:741 start_codon:yes stop_codon:yes gene_type:complete
MLNTTLYNNTELNMVKNSKGGKGSKKIARKHVMDITQRVIRYVKEDGEMYAVVSKHFGSQCEVVTSDGETRLCIVRGKFKGRQRRDNNISIGSWVMVGVRDWEIRGDGKTKCDLLYVYSDIDKEDLKQNAGINFAELDKINTEITGIKVDDSVVFKDDANDSYTNELLDFPDDSDVQDNLELHDELENASDLENYKNTVIASAVNASAVNASAVNASAVNQPTMPSKEKTTPVVEEDNYVFDIDEI